MPSSGRWLEGEPGFALICLERVWTKKDFLYLISVTIWIFPREQNGAENGITESLNEKIYNTKAQIVRELQAPVYSGDEIYADYRKSLVDDLKEDVISLNDDSFMVKRHLRYVEFSGLHHRGIILRQ